MEGRRVGRYQIIGWCDCGRMEGCHEESDYGRREVSDGWMDALMVSSGRREASGLHGLPPTEYDTFQKHGVRHAGAAAPRQNRSGAWSILWISHDSTILSVGTARRSAGPDF